MLDPDNPPPKKILDNPDYKYPAKNLTGADNTINNLVISKDGKYLGWKKSSSTGNPSVEYLETNELSLSKVKRIQSKVKRDYIEQFTWSPDGSCIATLERVGSNPKSSYKVRTFSIKTTNQIDEFEIVPPTKLQHSVNFTWSETDKIRAIFVKVLPLINKSTSEGEDYIVYSYSSKAEKGFEKVLYHDNYRPNFDISDDGENVAFVKKFQSGSSYRGELWFGKVDGSNIRRIADTTIQNCTNGSPLDISPDQSKVIVGSAAWSPDGMKIWVAESRFNPKGKPLSQNNYVLNSEGKITKKLDFYASDVVWFSQ